MTQLYLCDPGRFPSCVKDECFWQRHPLCGMPTKQSSVELITGFARAYNMCAETMNTDHAARWPDGSPMQSRVIVGRDERCRRR